MPNFLTIHPDKTMQKYIFFLFLLFIPLYSGWSQTASKKSLLEVGDKSFASKNYYDALIKYQQVLEFEPNNVEYLFKASEAARLHGAYQLAGLYLDSLWKHENGNQYTKTGFYRGQIAQSRCDFNSAISAYKIFISETGDSEPYLKALAEKEISACEWAMEQIDQPVKNVTVENLGPNINSDNSEFAPAPKNGKLIYSSNRFDNKSNKFIPRRTISGVLSMDKDSTVSVLKDFNEQFPGLNVAHICFNPTSNRIIFTVCEDLNDHDKRCDLYMAMVEDDGSWIKSEKLPEQVNFPNSSTTQPNWVKDQMTGLDRLYFVSDRPGGKGGYDIWYLTIDKDLKFSEPVNLSALNTPQDEMTPYYHHANQTFYFSSKGYLGMGGFDIYSSVVGRNLEFGKPNNMGTPFNSCLDDLYFVRDQDPKIAYLSSNRTGSIFLDDLTQACCLDLYKVFMPPCDVKLRAWVYDALTKQDLNGATLKLYDLKNPESEPIVITKENSNLYEFDILCDKEYRIEASKTGYNTENVQFMSGKPGEFEEIVKRIYLTPANVSLDVLTFDKQSQLDLNGTKVSLIDLSDTTIAPITILNPNTNLSQFKLEPCHKYKILAEKEGYAPASLEFTVDCLDRGKLTQKLFLDRILYSFLPLALYFDNDHPNPRTMDTITKLGYYTTYHRYYLRKSYFAERYSGISSGIDREDAQKDMNGFFEDSVKGGKEKLDAFIKILEKELAEGKKYVIYFKGYASPLASNHYNYHLSQRRIESVKNEFYRYKNGIFKKYLDNGKLVISEKPFGEDKAPTGISDNSKDPKSIYGIKASKERRVEIVDIDE
ncbi:MAG: PD40 domain-containing protein [Saprospiraceae bacterium]|nr:PD40 domain-containing protein [Saprospiraceae bacterium]